MGSAKEKNLKKIKIVQDEEDRQENIDNHSCQNYNVEHFCICTHEQSLFLHKQWVCEYHEKIDSVNKVN